MNYVDGFLIPVKNTKKQDYIDLAKAAAPVFKDYGALSVVETWGADVPDGKLTSFPMAVKKEDDETVVFSWIVWPSKAVRDEGMKKVMEDERMKCFEGQEMPFDGKRMVLGGFDIIVEL